MVGEDDEDLGGVAGPAWVPLGGRAPVRAITAGLREAMDDARRTGAVRAAPGRDARTARVWTPLGHHIFPVASTC